MKTERISLSTNEKIIFISNFSTMLSAGISILEAVDSLREDAKGNLSKMLETLRADLIQGNHVATTFARFPLIFDKVTVNIIKASEEAGTLDVTLKDLKKSILKEVEFTDKIKSALMYPFVILLVFIGVLLLMLIVVIPKISTVFLRLNVPLPLPTQVLIFTSNLLLTQTIPVLIVLGAFVGLIFFMYQRQKRILLNILFSFPLVSELVKEIDLTHFTRSLYLLLSSGITIINALELTEDVVIRHDVHEAIFQAKQTVLSGKKLSEGLRLYKGFIPNLMIKMIEAGEKTGSLDKSMQEISDYFDYQVSNRLRTLTALLEPIMLVFVGVLVGGMMLAIIAPIYNLIGSVGTR